MVCPSTGICRRGPTIRPNRRRYRARRCSYRRRGASTWKSSPTSRTLSSAAKTRPTSARRISARATTAAPRSGRFDVEVFADKPYIIISRKATADGRSPNFCAGYNGGTVFASRGIAYINPTLGLSATPHAAKPHALSATVATAADAFANLAPTGTDRAIVFTEVNGLYVTQIATRPTGSGNGKQPWVFEQHPFWLSPPNPRTAPGPP